MKCAFCKSDFDIPYGMTIIQKDGTSRHFCSSKCRKNAAMGRDSRKLKWVTKMLHNKAKAEEVKANSLARQEKASKDVAETNAKKAGKKSAKVARAKKKEEKIKKKEKKANQVEKSDKVEEKKFKDDLEY